MTPANDWTYLRFRFRKLGDLRFLSHHDLMRLVERMLRRAALPFRSTEGFHPKPKITFGNALSLGIVGWEEIVDIEFDGDLDPAAVLQQLQAASPSPELPFFAVERRSSRRAPQVIGLQYRFGPLPEEALGTVDRAIRTLLEAESAWVDRPKDRHLPAAAAEPAEERLDQRPAMPVGAAPEPRHGVKRFDLRPSLKALWRDGRTLYLECTVTPAGTARPEEVLRLLGWHEHFLQGEALLERTHLFLKELPADPASASPMPVEAEPIAVNP